MKSWIRCLLPKAIYYRLASLLASWRRWRFPTATVQHMYCGETLTIKIADAMAKDWYDCDWVERMPELDVLKDHRLRCGAKVFDIGAHQGVVALVLAHAVGDSGTVIAVEADPWNSRMGEENRRLNEAHNLRIIHAAVGEQDGRSNHHSHSGLDRIFAWSQKRVPFRSVDSLAREYGMPDVIYVDVDGFELAVLQGATAVLNTAADWFVEVHVGCGLEELGATWQDILAFFPPERFTRLISSDLAPEFVPFHGNSDLVRGRFYLLALIR